MCKVCPNNNNNNNIIPVERCKFLPFLAENKRLHNKPAMELCSLTVDVPFRVQPQ